MVKKIAVFSSGRGGNFNNICEYFKGIKNISVDLLVTNNLGSMSKKIADKYYNIHEESKLMKIKAKLLKLKAKVRAKFKNGILQEGNKMKED